MSAVPFFANAIDVGGGPAAGARLQSYVKDTTTPLGLWTDSGLSVPSTNPVIADADGRFEIYADSTEDYTWQIRSSDSATVLWEADITGGVLVVTYVNGILIEGSWGLALANPLGAGWSNAFGLPVSDLLPGPLWSEPFGIVGNGTADDEAALDDWLSDLVSGRAGSLEEGTFKTSDAALVASNSRISGRSRRLSTLKRDTDGQNLFAVTSKTNFEVTDLGINNDFGTNADNGHCITLDECSDFDLRNLYLYGFGGIASGVLVFSSTNTKYRGAYLHNLRADGVTSGSTDTNGVLLVDAEDAVVSDIYVKDVKSFAFEFKNDSRTSVATNIVSRNAVGGVVLGQTTVGEDGVDYCAISNAVAIACDQGLIIGEGKANSFSNFVVNSTSAPGSDIYGAFFSTDADQNALWGMVTFGTNMDFPLWFGADRCFASVASHDTATEMVTFASGVQKNLAFIAHPGARTSIFASSVINDASGNSAAGSTANVVVSPLTGERKGSVSGLFRDQLVAAPTAIALNGASRWVYEHNGDVYLTIRQAGTAGQAGGLAFNNALGALYAFLQYNHQGGTTNDSFRFGIGGSSSYDFFQTVFRPVSSGTATLGGSSNRWSITYTQTLDASVKIKNGTCTVATAPGGPSAGDQVFMTDLRVYDGAGVRQGAASGTGGLALYNGSAWKNADAQSITAAA